MKIINLKELNESQLAQAAQMLTDELPLGWPDFADAMDEINNRLNEPGAFFIAAVCGDEVLGWCGILETGYSSLFELHPLVVRSASQRKGIGTMLVDAISAAARERGALTLWLGADDERPGGETSLANVDLYDDLPGRLQNFNPGTHQAAFYMKLGFKVVGVMPDANGIGKPDIYFAKRLG